MTVTVQSIIDRVQAVLQDTTGVRWPVDSELVLWVNDAQRETVLFKPDASAINTTVTLASGTKQTIPDNGNRLLRVIRNMSAAASGTGGRAVRLVDREILDAQSPDWHDPLVSGNAAHGEEVKHFVYDVNDPRNYYVFPGVDGDAYLELVYSGNPVTVAIDDNIGIADIYSNALVDYVLYRAYSKDADYAANEQRANKHYQMFLTSVTGKQQIDTVSNPNGQRTGSPSGVRTNG